MLRGTFVSMHSAVYLVMVSVEKSDHRFFLQVKSVICGPPGWQGAAICINFLDGYSRKLPFYQTARSNRSLFTDSAL